MGCAQSRIENEESVTRCKDRKILMKEALLARSAFAAGHSAYAIALKNAGSALSDYGHGEAAVPVGSILSPAAHHHPPPGASAIPVPEPPPPLPADPLPPPPPPLPTFSPSPLLQRSVTMPEFSVSKRGAGVGVASMGALDEEGEEEEGGNVRGLSRSDSGVTVGVGIGNVDDKSGLDLKGMAWDYFYMQQENGHGLDEIGEEDEEGEEDDDDDEDDDEDGHDHDDEHEHHGGHGEEMGFITPEKARPEVGGMGMGMETPPRPLLEEEGIRHFVHSNTAPPEIGRTSVSKNESVKVLNVSASSKVNLMKVLEEIDDVFLKASQCAQEVTMLLEAHKLQYHSNYADTRVPIDHAARVMRVITWNRALKDMPDSGKDEYEDNETLATILDKLMAWEKKLYEEVKAGELMKMEYQRKVSLLNRQKKRGSGAETLEKTKAAVSHLHTRYIVDMQSMDSTVAEVNELRDQQLYPKLVDLVERMAKMWEDMCEHHDNQLQIATELKSLDVALVPRETTKPHHQCTRQLADVIKHWQDQFESLVNHQKHYIRSLHNWLKLNLVPIESNLKERERISSPIRIQNPPIQSLLHAWHDCLEKLPDEVTRTAISSFWAVIQTIILQQEEEIKLKESCEDLQKEYFRKNQAFEDWYHKYVQRKGPEAFEGEEGGKDPASERRFVVDSLKKRLDDEVERHRKLCLQVREKSLGTLRTRLPELFRALYEYAHACSDVYNKLRGVALSHSSNGVH